MFYLMHLREKDNERTTPYSNQEKKRITNIRSVYLKHFSI